MSPRAGPRLSIWWPTRCVSISPTPPAAAAPPDGTNNQIVAAMAIPDVEQLYARLGDWLVYACAAVGLAGAGIAFFRRSPATC